MSHHRFRAFVRLCGQLLLLGHHLHPFTSCSTIFKKVTARGERAKVRVNRPGMGNTTGVRLGCGGPTSMCTGVGNCTDWKNRQTSSDGLVLGPWGKNHSSTYEYPACGSTSTPRNPLEAPHETSTTVGGSSPARDLVRKFVRDMVQGKAARIPPVPGCLANFLNIQVIWCQAWPDVCAQPVIVSLDKRMKKLCVRSSDLSAEVSMQLAVPLTSIASIAFGCCNPGEGRLMSTELSVTIFLDEGYGPSIVLEFRDLEERDTFAICLSMFVDGRKVEVDGREKRSL
eukprot:s880_g37.t1